MNLAIQPRKKIMPWELYKPTLHNGVVHLGGRLMHSNICEGDGPYSLKRKKKKHPKKKNGFQLLGQNYNHIIGLKSWFPRNECE